jgi:N utilization substance protein B
MGGGPPLDGRGRAHQLVARILARDRGRPGRRRGDFATTLANCVAASIQELDPLIVEAAEHWRLERMAVMDRLILRLAVYEFLHQKGTPAKVIINEALELARTFSTDEAVKFINGILDGIRRTLERE